MSEFGILFWRVLLDGTNLGALRNGSFHYFCKTYNY